MKKVKIAHLTSAHPQVSTRIFHRECKTLAKRGYEVILIVPHERNEVVDGVRIKAVSKPRGRVERMTRTVWQVYREAVRLNADIYHFHDPELIMIGLLLQWGGKKVIYDIHEDVPRSILSRDYLPMWGRRLLGWLAEHVEQTSGPWFSALIPATPAIASRFVTLNDQTVAVQNFPLIEELAPSVGHSWDKRDCSVAYIGGIARERGIREMVKAMSFLPDRLNATLKLAGKFSSANIRDEVARLRGWKRVEELDFLNRRGVADLLSFARAGLVLFHPEPNHVSAQPNKLFEYMAAGIAVIASDFPLWRQIVEDSGCGLLVDPLDVKAIAEAIEYVLTHPQEAEAMGRRGREAVEKHYNWRSEERKLLLLYADLAGPVCLL